MYSAVGAAHVLSRLLFFAAAFAKNVDTFLQQVIKSTTIFSGTALLNVELSSCLQPCELNEPEILPGLSCFESSGDFDEVMSSPVLFSQQVVVFLVWRFPLCPVLPACDLEEAEEAEEALDALEVMDAQEAVEASDAVEKIEASDAVEKIDPSELFLL